MSSVVNAAKVSGNVLALRESQFVAMQAPAVTDVDGLPSLTLAAPAAMTDAEGYICIENTSSSVNGKVWVKPSYIELICTASGTGGVTQVAQFAIDDIARYTSGSGTMTTASTSVGSQGGTVITDRTPVAAVYAGPLVLAANNAEETLDVKRMRSVIPVVGDTYRFEFGEAGQGAAVTLNGTAPISHTMHVPEVSIGPGGSMVVRLVRASQTVAASFIVKVGWTEHGHGRFNG